MAAQSRTVVLYESPFRLKGLLTEIQTVFGEVEVFLGREISKMYEELWAGPVSELRELLEERSIKGEITLLVKPRREPDPEDRTSPPASGEGPGETIGRWNDH